MNELKALWNAGELFPALQFAISEISDLGDKNHTQAIKTAILTKQKPEMFKGRDISMLYRRGLYMLCDKFNLDFKKIPTR